MRIFSLLVFASFVGAAVCIDVNAGQLLVIDTTSTEFKSGEIIDSSRPIAIPESARLTLLAPTGEVLRLTGPYRGVPDSRLEHQPKSDLGLINSLQKLLSADSPDTRIIGTTRGSAGDVWQLNSVRSGTHCIPSSDGPPVIGRQTSIQPLALDIESLEPSGEKFHVYFNTRQRTAIWPAMLPVRDGAAYQMRSGQDNNPIVIILRIVPDSLDGLYLISWMGDHGCIAQARRMLRALR